MKILVDMNLSPDWLPYFKAEGWEALHWSEIGDVHADDREIFDWAAKNDYLVFTHDLDFSAILAATNAGKPSVVQVRIQNVLPEALAPRFIILLKQYADDLAAGAILTIDPANAKVRVLPLR
jgi:predicted nuclease of predicted toxin-antitoxin system